MQLRAAVLLAVLSFGSASSSSVGRPHRPLVLRGGANEDQLAQAETFTFEEALPWLKFVRMHGVRQFIAHYHQLKDVESEELMWGDEIEYHLVHVDAEAKSVKILLRGTEVREELAEKEKSLGRSDGYGEACAWHPE